MTRSRLRTGVSVCLAAGVLGAAAGCEAPRGEAAPPDVSATTAALTAPLPAPLRVFGQPDLKQTSLNEVVAYRSFQPSGVLVDRALAAGTPSRLFVWDSGNNRVLGFDAFGTCSGGTRPGSACTETSFCGAGGACVPSSTQAARFAVGQPSLTGQGACNGDNTTTAPATASSLCLVPYPTQISPLEGPRGGQMTTDTARNLYLVDTFNNRVLRYNDPFGTDRVADWQFGQPDFASRACNRGGGPTSQTLCTGEVQQDRFFYFFTSAVAVSPDGQSIWVADPGNHRVLRLAPGQAAANLVLGQASFTTADSGCNNDITDASRMCAPTGVAFDAVSNRLYVLDGYVEGPRISEARILVYQNPTTSGQAPTTIWTMPAGTSFLWPRGLTLEPSGGALWVSDTDHSRALRFVNGAVTHVLSDSDLDSPGCIGGAPCSVHGSIGIDRDGGLYLCDHASQHVLKYAAATPLGQPPPSPVASLFDQPALGNDVLNANHVGPAGFANPGFVAFAGNQMVVADQYRILFWNDYAAGGLAGGDASGVIGQPSFNTQRADLSVTNGSVFTSLAVDAARSRLYATALDQIMVWGTAGGLASQAPYLELFRAGDLLTVAGQPLNCNQGCSIVNVFVDSARDAGWLVDTTNNRVLRVTNFSSPSARRIDLVLGQASLDVRTCNRGAGNGNVMGNVRPDGFCDPAQVTLDAAGNLYVVDGTWECREGNCRVVEFNAARVPAASNTLKFPSLAPDRVFGPSDFTSRDCDPATGRLCSPRFIAFDPADGSMVATGEAYHNPIDARFALWATPTPAGVTSPVPTAFLGLRINQAGPIAFDGQGRMAVLDHTWNRVTLFQVGAAPPAEIRTAFRTSNGQNYITADNDGGSSVSTNRTSISATEIFAIEDLNGGLLMSGDNIHIRHDSHSGRHWYAVAETNSTGGSGGGGPGSRLRVSRTAAANWETFTITKAGGGQIVSGSAVNLRAFHPYYVSAINGGGKVGDGSVVVDRTNAANWERFTMIFQ